MHPRCLRPGNDKDRSSYGSIPMDHFMDRSLWISSQVSSVQAEQFASMLWCWEPKTFTVHNMSNTRRREMHSSFFVFQHIWQCIGIQFFLYLISLKWLTFKTSILNPLSDVGPSGICKAWTKASVNCCTTGKIRTLAAPWLQSMQAQVNIRYKTLMPNK